jgi:hypothetical protein
MMMSSFHQKPVILSTNRKSGGEGPTCDCFCDSYVQLMLGMSVRSTGDTAA